MTAVDQNDHLFADANQGPYIAVAAPGVNVLEPAPDSGYQITTGTSVAAAHVTGVAALMLERNRSLDPDTVHEILTSSAKPLAPGRRNDQYGWGLVDPAKALFDIDTQRANDRQKKPRQGCRPKARHVVFALIRPRTGEIPVAEVVDRGFTAGRGRRD